MLEPAAIVAEARTWLGTPFLHQGRLRGAGVDCVGFVVEVAKTVGAHWYDAPDYMRLPDPAMMGALLREHLDVIPFADVRPGDILWFRVDQDPQHLAIVTETGPDLKIIHAYSGRIPAHNKVIEHIVGGYWLNRLQGCFRYREGP